MTLFFWLDLGALPSGHVFGFLAPHVAIRIKRKFLCSLSLRAWDPPPEERYLTDVQKTGKLLVLLLPRHTLNTSLS